MSVQQDERPEVLHPDNGCDVSHSCVKCPLLFCKHDDMRYYLAWKHQKERAQRLPDGWESMTVDELAQTLSVSKRTIQRWKQQRN